MEELLEFLGKFKVTCRKCGEEAKLIIELEDYHEYGYGGEIFDTKEAAVYASCPHCGEFYTEYIT